MNGDVLIDEALVADPIADRELGPGDIQTLADDELEGARIHIVRNATQRVELASGAGTALVLTSTLHAPPGARFSHAEIRWLLVEPADAVIIDVAPEQVADTTPLTFKISKGGKFVLSVPEAAQVNLGVDSLTEFTVYHCLVRSSGSGSRRARWTFSENPKTLQGVSHSNRLGIILSGEGPFAADLLVSARLIKPGLAGQLARIRDLVLGPHLQPGSRQRIPIPVPPAESGPRMDPAT